MTNYFPHDFNARTDPKLQNLLMEYGVAGIGVYWCIVEMLYEQDGKIKLKDIKSIAFALHTDIKVVNDIVLNTDLFVCDETFFYSTSVDRRRGIREDIRQQRKRAADIRWQREEQCTSNASALQEQCTSNASALQEQCTSNASALQEQCICNASALQEQCICNAIKEKEKKSKVKKSKEKENKNIVVVVDAHTREEFKTEVANSTIKRQQVCYNLRISESEFNQIANEVFNEWEISDANDWNWTHFINTMRVKVNAHRKQEQEAQQQRKGKITYAENKRMREQAALELLKDY